jgi:hypothetical protein
MQRSDRFAERGYQKIKNACKCPVPSHCFLQSRPDGPGPLIKEPQRITPNAAALVFPLLRSTRSGFATRGAVQQAQYTHPCATQEGVANNRVGMTVAISQSRGVPCRSEAAGFRCDSGCLAVWRSWCGRKTSHVQRHHARRGKRIVAGD